MDPTNYIEGSEEFVFTSDTRETFHTKCHMFGDQRGLLDIAQSNVFRDSMIDVFVLEPDFVATVSRGLRRITYSDIRANVILFAATRFRSTICCLWGNLDAGRRLSVGVGFRATARLTLTGFFD